VSDPRLRHSSFRLIPRPGTDVGLQAAPVEHYCPVIAEPPTGVIVRAALLGGLTSLTVSGTPIDPISFANAIARVDGVDVPLMFDGDEIGGTLTLATPAEPNQVVTIELPGIETRTRDSESAPAPSGF